MSRCALELSEITSSRRHLLRKPQFAGAGPVHIDVHHGNIVDLVNMHIRGPRNLRNRAGNLLRKRVILSRFRGGPITCTSTGAGRPKFRIWPTISAGWKKKSSDPETRAEAACASRDIIPRSNR